MDWLLYNPAILFLLVQKIWKWSEEKATLTQSTVNEEEQKKEERIVFHCNPEKQPLCSRFSWSLTSGGQPFHRSLVVKLSLTSAYSNNSKCGDHYRNVSRLNILIWILSRSTCPIKHQFIHIRLFIIATFFTCKLWGVTKIVRWISNTDSHAISQFRGWNTWCQTHQFKLIWALTRKFQFPVWTHLYSRAH